MRERTTDKVTIFTAQQNYQHKQCYKLETSTSLKILRSLQSRTSVGNVSQENLTNLNKVIDRKVVEIYLKEKQNSGYLSGIFKSMQMFLQIRLSHFSNSVLQEEEELQHDLSEDWVPDEEDNAGEEDDSIL
ncbi:unnamed protein product (macronuclear) [Paramecium tetraurelia]|uniref:Uncharacterized protein n=1 Tax=Paramecium tetraurelia TaxID=5888 RepID=A0DGB6_PARTE|nr:uncharacterized protein GSPATT00002212001 [Paramecium tetraurelia]CAK82083.1 unnamed protein product [Paramecium tetraurelia]|eukprot:XP_001449480.1 hypothetical protein (macronuclear) [Paramecium tetraurelia strain d4-2]